MLTFIEHSTAKDGPRYEKIILEAIKENKVPEYKCFYSATTKEAHQARIDKEEKEQAAFDKNQAKKNKKNKKEKEEDTSLLELIQQRAKNRQANMTSIIESIEEKSGKKRKQATDDLPSEEEFQKLQEKLFSKKQKKN